MRSPSAFTRLIGLGFAALIAAGLIVTVAASAALYQLRRTQEQLIGEYTEALLDVEQLRSLLVRRADASAAYLLTGAPGFLDERAALTIQIEREKRALRETGGPRRVAQLERVLRIDAEFNAAFHRSVAERDSGSEAALSRWRAEVAPLRDQLDTALNDLVGLYEARFREAAARSNALATRLLWTTIAIAVVALPVGSALALGVARALSRLHRREQEAKELLEREEQVQRLLAESGAALAASLEDGLSVETLARIATRDFADVCFVDLLDEESGAFRRVCVETRRPEDAELADALRAFPPTPGDRSPAAHAVRTCQSEHLAELTERLLDERFTPLERRRALQALGTCSLIAVPVVAVGRAVGALTFLRLHPGPPYTRRDVGLAEELARRLAVSLENARLYEMQRRAVEARDRVLAIVSHDLKNPLGVVLMSAQQLRRTGGDEARVPRLAERIEIAAHRMERLIRDLLDLASLDAGRLAIQPGIQAPEVLVAEVLEQLRPLAAARRVSLSARAPPDLPPVRADAHRVEQVLSNLVANAIKFAPEDGFVEVALSEADGAVRFSVSDNGPGIPAEQRAHVFERFWQARPGEKLGSGLGLSIAKGLVEAHGGHIWVEPRTEGSTFSFTLPRSPANGASATPLP